MRAGWAAVWPRVLRLLGGMWGAREFLAAAPDAQCGWTLMQQALSTHVMDGTLGKQGLSSQTMHVPSQRGAGVRAAPPLTVWRGWSPGAPAGASNKESIFAVLG